MMKLAIIPARGGSKRIPRKNIKNFFGKPVIGYTIEILIQSNFFDNIIVTTDDEEIANIAREFGADVPWIRSCELSNDTTTTDAVIRHALAEASMIYGEFNFGCCVYPVNPLLSIEMLQNGLSQLQIHNAATAFPVVRFEFPIQQALLLNNGRPHFRSPEAASINSQDLPVHYHDAGMFYWFDISKYRNNPFLFSDDSIAFEVDQLQCQDINTAQDWELAELKFSRLKASQKK